MLEKKKKKKAHGKIHEDLKKKRQLGLSVVISRKVLYE